MKILVIAICICLSFASISQNTNISGVINNYTSASVVSGNSITVASSSSFNIGDLVLLVQMQGAIIDESNSATFGDITSIGDAGNYEFATICSIPSATEIVVNSIQRSYSPSGIVQLVSVPVYDDATVTGTLTASPWNGSTGGILTFQCTGTLTMNAGIDLHGSGFRGADVTTSTYSCSWFINVTNYFYDLSTGEGAKKGEGVSLYIPGKTGGRGAQANGGGGSNDHNGGGGGGANASLGGVGGERIPASTFTCKSTAPGAGGKPNTYSNSVNKFFLGGGGGAGHENNAAAGSPGSNGGGIVIIKATSLNGNGQLINVEGGPTPVNSFDGSGGGGAGGTVLLDVTSYSGALSISANGTDGGSVNNSGASNCNGPGGGGSGGVLWVNQSSVPANISFNNNGGQAGTTLSASQSNCDVGSTNSAQEGNTGSTITSLVLFENTCNSPVIATMTTICSSDSLFLEGQWQSTSGVYLDTIAVGCCDSIVETTLTVLQDVTGLLDQTLCAGDSIIVNGTTYNSAVIGATELFTNVGVNGCDSLVTINLTILPALTGTINQSICAGDSIVVNGTTYNSTVTGATEVFTNVGPNNCDSVVTINLTVTPIDATLTDTSPTLTANLAGASYQWITCPGMTVIPGATSQSYTATIDGDYAVIVTNNGCSDTSECYTVIIIGIVENDFKNGLVIFPNPTDGNFSIDLGDNHQSVNITISDLNGKTIQSKTYFDTQFIDLKLEESSGIYLLMIETEDEKAVVRLAKE
jgi:hypothetical protein